jgi:hypothetical protein
MYPSTETVESVRHVDIVKNEWLAGFQMVVARLLMEDGKLRVDTNAPDVWEPIVWRPLVDRETGEKIGPDRTEDFFSRLHERMSGDYLFATEPHDDKTCPYHDSLVVPIEPGELTRQFEIAH